MLAVAQVTPLPEVPRAREPLLGDIRGSRFHIRAHTVGNRRSLRIHGHPQSGHQAEAFATQCRGWLLAQSRGVCRNASDAEDLVQETLLRFIQNGSEGPA